MQDATGGQSLLSIYDVYEKLKGKSNASTAGSSSANEARPSTSSTSSKETEIKPAEQGGTNKEAEGYKSTGNVAMARKDYPSAIDVYSKVIASESLNFIYLFNRAAAYFASHKHHEAQIDVEMIVTADLNYIKA